MEFAEFWCNMFQSPQHIQKKIHKAFGRRPSDIIETTPLVLIGHPRRARWYWLSCKSPHYQWPWQIQLLNRHSHRRPHLSSASGNSTLISNGRKGESSGLIHHSTIPLLQWTKCTWQRVSKSAQKALQKHIMKQTDTRSGGVMMPWKVFSGVFRYRHVQYNVCSQKCALISVIERKRVVARRRKCSNTISSTRLGRWIFGSCLFG